MLILSLCACAQTQPDAFPDNSLSQQKMTEVWRSQAWFDIAPIAAEHGGDYAIEWEDPGMEAHVRLWLGKPEGDILHSDVWDIQAVSIQPYSTSPYDIALVQPTEGGTSFTMESILLDQDARISYDRNQIPVPQSLGDLRHFDSLQIFRMECRQTEGTVLDISGLAQCPNLKAVHLDGAEIESMAPFAQISALENLWLDSCSALDLTPLENHPSLCALSFQGSRILSLEPLTTLPKLSYLSIGNEADFPSLEPLTRTRVQFLDMGLSISGKNRYDGLDYASLERMPALVYLDLSNHTAVDTALCEGILAGSPELKYLDISYTPGAQKPDALQTDRLDAFLCVP